MSGDALERLGTLFGIEPGYTATDGTEQPTLAHSYKALLDAMGVDVTSDSTIEAALEAEETRRREALIEPVVAIQPGRRLTVPLGPAARGGVGWCITLENGETLRGQAEVAADALDLELADRLPMGYHRIEIEVGERSAEALMIAAPERCPVPDDLGLDRSWGLACQLASLRGEVDLGTGALGDLTPLIEKAAAEGVDFLGLNPLHALFPAEPALISPYAPSSRQFLNIQAISPELVPEIAEDEEAQRLLAEKVVEAGAMKKDLADHVAAARARLAVLERLFAHFKAKHLEADPPSERARAFEAFRETGGAALEGQCLFDALHEHFMAETRSWWRWPEPYRHLESREIEAFREKHADRLTFFAWLQWLADQQLERAQAAARAAGMRIGLYRDLAIGVSPDGGMAFSQPEATVTGATVGAPPDAFSPQGQNWQLAPLSPRALIAMELAPFIADVRANMRHAGALRIDHVMGLARLFWIPNDASPTDGAYVRYPLELMRAVLSLEAHRHGCLVIGEDLGTLPHGFHEVMERSAFLSCKVLYFERREGGRLKPVEDFPKLAAVSIGTHDLPTLKGYWQGRDIDWRDKLDLFAQPGQAEREEAARAEDRARLVESLREAGLAEVAAPPDTLPDELIAAFHRYIARTPSALALVQLEDLTGQVEQVNLPGTIDEHPNWRRRLPMQAGEVFADGLARAIAAAMREERPR